MRRFAAVGLICALAFTFVGSPMSRAATIGSSWPVGSQPFTVAVDDATGKVYVADSGSVVYDINNPSSGPHGLISVVDPATGSVGRILTSLTSNFILVDTAGRRLYSSNGDINTGTRSVEVFDLDSGTRLASVGVGGLGMALDRAAGRLYVCESGSIKVIDTTTFAVLASATAPMSAGWFSVASDPDRHHLYVTNIYEASPSLFVLDDRDLTTVATIPLPTATRFAIAVDPVTHYLFVAGGRYDGQAFTSALSAIDPDTLKVVHQTSMAGYVLGMTLAPAKHRIYLSDNNGWRLYGVDDTTFTVAETMRLSFAPGELLMHADGRLFAGDYESSSHLDSRLVALDLANHAPIFGSLTLTPLLAYTGDTLRADPSAYDPDFGPSLGRTAVAYTYEWSRNGVVLVSETGATLDLSAAGNGDRGDTISVRVTASDGELSTDASTSLVIGDSAPSAAAKLSDSAPSTNTVMTATAIGTDSDGDALTFRFVWKVNGVVRRSTSGSTSLDTFDLGGAGNGDHGDAVVVEVVASDGNLDSGVATAAATVVNSPPTVAVALNTTAPTTKTVLVATAAGQDADRDALTYVYTWKLNGVVKRTVTTTATSDRFDISLKGNGKKGDVVTVTVTASDGTLTSPAASLAATIR
jgi:DNA-binding beta-propeller fold protein YncE